MPVHLWSRPSVPVPTGTEAESWRRTAWRRLEEYAAWGDPASQIVPDPGQAERVDRAIRARQREAGPLVLPAMRAGPLPDHPATRKPLSGSFR